MIILARLFKASMKDDMQSIADQKIKSYVVECKSEEVTYHYEIEYEK